MLYYVLLYAALVMCGRARELLAASRGVLIWKFRVTRVYGTFIKFVTFARRWFVVGCFSTWTLGLLCVWNGWSFGNWWVMAEEKICTCRWRVFLFKIYCFKVNFELETLIIKFWIYYIILIWTFMKVEIHNYRILWTLGVFFKYDWN